MINLMFGLSKENISQEQASEWVRQGIVTQEQANKLLENIQENRKNSDSKRFVLIISGLGVISICFGAISFLAMNWEFYSIFFKIFIFLMSTFLAFFLGYYFQYINQNYKIVGSSLIFLGSLLFGGTLLQFSQYYNESSSDHLIFLIWLLGILPVIYIFESLWVARLSVLLFLYWIYQFFIGSNLIMNFDYSILLAIPVISSLFIYLIGYLHHFTKYIDIGKLYRQDGLRLSLAFVFYNLIMWDSIAPFFSENRYSDLYYEYSRNLNTGIGLYFIFTFLIIELIFSLILLFFRNKYEQLKNSLLEISPVLILIICLILTTSVAAFQLFSMNYFSIFLKIFYNIFFICVSLIVLYVGFKKSELRVFDSGISSSVFYILYKYFYWFYNIFDGTLFFTFGGIFLVLLGILIEKQRNNLKVNSKNMNQKPNITFYDA